MIDPSLETFLADLRKRVEILERTGTRGKFVAEYLTADPAVKNGRVYYNTTTNKLRKCVNGAWSDVG